MRTSQGWTRQCRQGRWGGGGGGKGGKFWGQGLLGKRSAGAETALVTDLGFCSRLSSPPPVTPRLFICHVQRRPIPSGYAAATAAPRAHVTHPATPHPPSHFVPKSNPPSVLVCLGPLRRRHLPPQRLLAACHLPQAHVPHPAAPHLPSHSMHVSTPPPTLVCIGPVRGRLLPQRLPAASQLPQAHASYPAALHIPSHFHTSPHTCAHRPCAPPPASPAPSRC